MGDIFGQLSTALQWGTDNLQLVLLAGGAWWVFLRLLDRKSPQDLEADRIYRALQGQGREAGERSRY